MKFLLPITFIALATPHLVSSAPLAPLPPAHYRANVSGGPSTSFSAFDSEALAADVPVSVNLDLAGVHQGTSAPLYSYSIQVQAEAFGGLQPMAVATAETHGTQLSSNATFGGKSFASVEYYLRVLPNDPNNTYDGPIPVTVHVRADVTGKADARIIIGSNNTLLETLTGHKSIDGISRRQLFPGQPLHVHLTANATAEENYGLGPPRANSSQSVADPVFDFDQPAFDELMGPNTFPLAAAFSFDYSPGLIPEPATLTYALALLPALTRRPRRPTPPPV